MTLLAKNTHGMSMRCFCHVPPGTNGNYWLAFNIPTGVNSLTLRSMDITGAKYTTNFTVKETYIYGLSAAVLLYTTENISNRMVSFDALIG